MNTITPGTTLNFLGNKLTYRLTDAPAGGLVEVEMGPEAVFALPHVHEREDEIVYVIEGTVQVSVGDETIEASDGESVFMPRGIPHAVASVTAARILLFLTPGGMEPFFAEMAAMTEGFPPIPKEAMNDFEGFLLKGMPEQGPTIFQGLVEMLGKYNMRPVRSM